MVRFVSLSEVLWLTIVMTRVTSSAVGRPPDEKLTTEILAETLRQLQAGAYSNLRIERVAASVGCGKTAIYRRWESRAALAAAALVSASELGEVPNTGDVVDDLCAHAWRNVKNQRSPRFTGADGHNIWASMMDPEVRELFWDAFLTHRRRMGRQIIDRSVARRELSAAVNADLILDALAGLTLYRNTIRIAELRKQDIDDLVRALINITRRGDSTSSHRPNEQQEEKTNDG